MDNFEKQFERIIEIQVPKINNVIIDKINTGLEILKKRAEEISPEKTRRFIRNHEIKKASVIGNAIIGSLENDTPYAYKLEFGVDRVMNYRKYKGNKREIIYTGVGNRTYTRTLDELESEILNLLKQPF